jgi:SAM-dependent methyltransferase
MPRPSNPLTRLLHSLRNAVDYPLRQGIRLRRAGLVLRNEAKYDLFAHLPPDRREGAEGRAASLLKAYHLQDFYDQSPRENYRENLYYLELLEQALEAAPASLPDPLRAADVGPSHWFYVQALYGLLKYWRCPAGRAVELSGYEMDAYRVYADLHSRYDHAMAHVGSLEGVRYLPQAFTPQPAAFDLAIQLFPFIFLPDHLEWGLPSGTFEPSGLLRDVWDSLKPGGLLVIANQGETEHAAQIEMLGKVGITPRAAFCFESPFFHYDIQHYVLVSRRDG